MQQHQLRDLIGKYERGECSAEELNMLNAWYEELGNPAEDEPQDPAAKEELKSSIWAAIAEITRMDGDSGVEDDSPRHGFAIGERRRRIWVYGSVAACIAGFLLCWSLGLFRASVPASIYITKITARGEVTKLLLPDHSIAWLNGKSRLRFPAEMDQDRKIFLDEGEAFFEVRHDEKRPFIVETASGLRTQVLGTSFTITSYRGMPAEKVIVMSGSVRVVDSTHNYGVFNKGQGASINVRSGTGTSLAADSAEGKGWTSGKVNLNNVSFAELATALENTYGIAVEFDQGALGGCRSSISFSRADSLRYVLDILKTIYKIAYKVDIGSHVVHITAPATSEINRRPS